MIHDPLCLRASHPKICEGDGSACPTCQCELIAKVRQAIVDGLKAGLPESGTRDSAVAIAAFATSAP